MYNYLTTVGSILLIILSGCGNNADYDREEWVNLFNNENLDGWNLKIRGYNLNDNYGKTFRVEDEMMKVRYDEYETFDDRFGHIFYEEPFTYYRLIVEYRFVGEQIEGGDGWAYRNNGIMFHSQSAESMNFDQDFPDSIEFQLLGGDGENDRPNGSICTPGTHVVVDGELQTVHCISSNGPTHHGNQWVKAELIAYGDSLLIHKLNDEVVIEYSGTQLDDGTEIGSGYIALQSESHPIDIRAVRLLNLEGCMDENSSHYRSYFVKHDENEC